MLVTLERAGCGLALVALKMTDQRDKTRNSSGDEIANVNFIYDDIVHALKKQ